MNKHPAVTKYEAGLITSKTHSSSEVIDSQWLKGLCRSLGADDVGVVSLDRSELDSDRSDILKAFPRAQALVTIIHKMNREPIRSPERSISNLEFHSNYKRLDDIAKNIVRALEDEGWAALNPAAGFPMEMDRFPGKIWIVSHKKVAEAAGLGKMGIHRNLIHPKFGNFVNLDTIILGHPISSEDRPIDYNPCLECKLCVAACPVGAISPAGEFNFITCSTHNYREFMSGFTTWVEDVTESKDRFEYRDKFTQAESSSMWQSLSFGANYKAAYCLSVCPAGEDVIGPFLNDRRVFAQESLRPLTEKREIIYVAKNSDAEGYVEKRFPHKTVKSVRTGTRASSIAAFLRVMSIVFQRGKSKGLDATYHFIFTGQETEEATVRIQNQTLKVTHSLVGEADCTVRADSKTWLHFLEGRIGIFRALLTMKVRIKGDPRLLARFGNCFPR